MVVIKYILQVGPGHSNRSIRVFRAEATAGAPDTSVSLSCPVLDSERKESVDLDLSSVKVAACLTTNLITPVSTTLA